VGRKSVVIAKGAGDLNSRRSHSGPKDCSTNIFTHKTYLTKLGHERTLDT
jgi:hypothetical protein